MSGVDFLDTNVLVYAYDERFPERQRIAQDLLHKALSGQMIISSQVLAEFATTVLHKFKPAATVQELIEILDVLAPIRTVFADFEILRRAVECHAKYGLHLYDGMIVAAAERAGCDRILSEDFNATQNYFGVTVSNPFV